MSELFQFWDDAERHAAAGTSPAERIALRNRFIREHFDRDMTQVGWKRLLPGDKLPFTVDAVVVGVALWNRRNLDLLAEIAKTAELQSQWYVFDIDDVKSPEDLERYMPGVPLPSATPVYAEYRGGRMVRSAYGAVAEAELRPKS